MAKQTTRKLKSVNGKIDGKLPPQAIELEEAVLGALMLDNEALSDTIDILKPEYFYRMEHQKIFDAIIVLFNESKPVDILTVIEQLKKMGALENIGGAFYITGLTNSVASSANTEYHARIIVEKFIQPLIYCFTHIYIHYITNNFIQFFRNFSAIPAQGGDRTHGHSVKSRALYH